MLPAFGQAFMQITRGAIIQPIILLLGGVIVAVAVDITQIC